MTGAMTGAGQARPGGIPGAAGVPPRADRAPEPAARPAGPASASRSFGGAATAPSAAIARPVPDAVMPDAATPAAPPREAGSSEPGAGRRAPGGSAAWAAARRVLAVRLDAMGDVLMSAPALAALKGSGREGGARHLTLLTSPQGAEAARLIAAVDEVVVHAPPWMKAPGPADPGADTGADPGADLALIDTLRRGAHDAAAILTVHSQSPLPAALACHLAGIPLRLAHCRENPYRLLTTWVRETEPGLHLRHEARRQLDLVAAVGLAAPDERVALSIPPDTLAAADHRLRLLGLAHADRWAVVHPGASAPSRRYPAEALERVVRILTERHGWRVLVTGSAGEAALAARVARSPGALSLAGDLDLAQLAALIARAPVVVTGNTGPAHLAAALGRPVIDLYALTNLQHAPWRARGRVLFHDVPCRVCLKSVCPEGHHLCLRGVPPEAVVAAAREALAGRAPSIPEDPAALFGPSGLRRGADEARDEAGDGDRDEARDPAPAAPSGLPAAAS